MVIGRKQGIALLIFGLVLLTGGILVLITVPAWGDWIADYPALVMQQEIPDQAAPVVQAMIGFVFGPLLEQVGDYMRIAGYFMGSLLTLVSIVIASAGTMASMKRV